MATITTTAVSTTDSSTISVTTLDGASDTFTLTTATGLLILENPTGGAISPIITGDGSATVECQGVGVIDVSGGTDIFGSISAGAEKVLKVNIVKEYLQGTITITSGSTLTARFLEL